MPDIEFTYSVKFRENHSLVTLSNKVPEIVARVLSGHSIKVDPEKISTDFFERHRYGKGNDLQVDISAYDFPHRIKCADEHTKIVVDEIRKLLGEGFSLSVRIWLMKVGVYESS